MKALKLNMMTREQKDFIYDSCAALYDDPEDAGIIAKATVIKIERNMISFTEFIEGVLRRKGLRQKTRNRLRESLKKWGQ